MSLLALAWVFETEIKPATCKLVMLAMADHVDENGFCYPSINALIAKTSLERKTIIETLARLEKMGLLIDTRKRIGVTGRIKVWRINGLPSSSHHYVYQLSIPSGEYYIGVRSCWATPQEDTAYLGSGSWPTKMAKTKTKLNKKIIGIFETRQQAEIAERDAIAEHLSDPMCMNKSSQKRNDSENGTIDDNYLKPLNDPENGIIPFLPSNHPKNGTGILKKERHAAEEIRGGSLRGEKRGQGEKSSFPVDFQISPSMATWATKTFPALNVQETTEVWADSMRASPDKYQYSDWEAAWRNGIRNAVKWGKAVYGSAGKNPNDNQPKVIL